MNNCHLGEEIKVDIYFTAMDDDVMKGPMGMLKKWGKLVDLCTPMQAWKREHFFSKETRNF